MGNRVRQVSLAEATLDIRKIYQQIFGDRDRPRIRHTRVAVVNTGGLRWQLKNRKQIRLRDHY
jgi:hypothetical protein